MVLSQLLFKRLKLSPITSSGHWLWRRWGVLIKLLFFIFSTSLKNMALSAKQKVLIVLSIYLLGYIPKEYMVTVRKLRCFRSKKLQPTGRVYLYLYQWRISVEGTGDLDVPPTTLPSDFFTTWLKPIFFQLWSEIRVLKIKSLNIF